MTDLSQPWSPPESKGVQAVIKYGSMAAIAGAGIYAFTLFAPTGIAAIGLLDTMLQDVTHMAISGGVLIATLWVLHETFSSSGVINRLLRLPGTMLVNAVTRALFTIDPLSPITTRLNAVLQDKQMFEDQFEKLDGIISNLKEKEVKYRDLSAQAQRQGLAAQRQGMAALVDVSAHKFGSYKDAADSYAKMRLRLEPIRTTFQQISQSCDVTAQKLALDRDLMADQWKTAQTVGSATSAANRVLGRSRTQVWNDAEQCEEIIQTKYGEELGHLDHLKRSTEPFLESINIENASYSEEMLQGIQATVPKLVQSTAATALPSPSMSTADNADAMAGLFR